MVEHQIVKGLTATYTKKTNTNDIYPTTHTGTLNYLVSTPAIMLMVVDASTAMLDKYLPEDFITVGKKIDLVHEHPSLVGETITLKLEVDEVDTHMVSMKIEVNDSKGIVCTGSYERAIINANKLLDIAYKRAPELI